MHNNTHENTHATPMCPHAHTQVLATHQAAKCCSYSRYHGLIAVDACCGCGGNIIQMGLMSPHVIGIEISSERIAMAAHNAKIYGVQDK